MERKNEDMGYVDNEDNNSSSLNTSSGMESEDQMIMLRKSQKMKNSHFLVQTNSRNIESTSDTPDINNTNKPRQEHNIIDIPAAVPKKEQSNYLLRDRDLESDSYAYTVEDNYAMVNLNHSANCYNQVDDLRSSTESQPTGSASNLKQSHTYQFTPTFPKPRSSDQIRRRPSVKNQPTSREINNLFYGKTQNYQNWHESYMYTLSLPHGFERYDRVSKLARSFNYTALIYAQIIVNEVCLPVDQKSIKPVNVGGQAGGSKYIVAGILFKFALNELEIYDNDENAMKAANHELKGAIQVNNCQIPKLLTPLMCLIDYKGFRVLAIALMPLSEDTLKYGSNNGGRTVYADPDVEGKMKMLGNKLNLKPHLAGNEGATKRLYGGPADIEVHAVDDNFFLIDMARLFPPESSRGFLHKLLRPEAVRRFHKPLCSDAWTKFQKCDPDAPQHNQDVADANDWIKKKLIPELCNKLDSFNEPFDITYEFHKFGVNMRKLGAVWEGCQSAHAKKLCLSEMTARVLASVMREQYRRTMNSLQKPQDEAFKTVAATLLNLVLGVEDVQRTIVFWTELKAIILSKFEFEAQFLNNIRFGLEMELNEGAGEWSGTPLDHIFVIYTLNRLQSLTGIEFDSKTMRSLGNQIDKSAELSVVFAETDITIIHARIKQLGITNLSEAKAFGFKAKKTNDYIERYRLILLAHEAYKKTILGRPGDCELLLEWATNLNDVAGSAPLEQASKLLEMADHVYEDAHQAASSLEQTQLLSQILVQQGQLLFRWASILNDKEKKSLVLERCRKKFYEALDFDISILDEFIRSAIVDQREILTQMLKLFSKCSPILNRILDKFSLTIVDFSGTSMDQDSWKLLGEVGLFRKTKDLLVNNCQLGENIDLTLQRIPQYCPELTTLNIGELKSSLAIPKLESLCEKITSLGFVTVPSELEAKFSDTTLRKFGSQYNCMVNFSPSIYLGSEIIDLEIIDNSVIFVTRDEKEHQYSYGEIDLSNLKIKRGSETIKSNCAPCFAMGVGCINLCYGTSAHVFSDPVSTRGIFSQKATVGKVLPSSLPSSLQTMIDQDKLYITSAFVTGTQLWIGMSGNVIYYWQSMHQKEPHRIIYTDHKYISTLAVLPKKQLVFYGTPENYAVTCISDAGEYKYKLPCPSPVKLVKVDRHFVYACCDTLIQIFSFQGVLQRSLQLSALTNWTQCTDIAVFESCVSACFSDGSIRTWEKNSAQGKKLRSSSDRVNTLTSKHGIVISGGIDGTVRIDAASKLHILAAFGTVEQIKKYLQHHPAEVFFKDFRGFEPIYAAISAAKMENVLNLIAYYDKKILEKFVLPYIKSHHKLAYYVTLYQLLKSYLKGQPTYTMSPHCGKCATTFPSWTVAIDHESDCSRSTLDPDTFLALTNSLKKSVQVPSVPKPTHSPTARQNTSTPKNTSTSAHRNDDDDDELQQVLLLSMQMQEKPKDLSQELAEFSKQMRLDSSTQEPRSFLHTSTSSVGSLNPLKRSVMDEDDELDIIANKEEEEEEEEFEMEEEEEFEEEE